MIAAALGSVLAVALLAPAPAALPQVVNTAATVNVQQVGQITRALVTVTRLSRAVPVTVTWGDGSTTRLSTSCTAAEASRGPLRDCRVRGRHDFTASGSYEVRVMRGSRLLASQMVTVAGTVPVPPSPSPSPEAPAPSAPAPSAWQQDMLARLNAIRAEVGAAPLTLCGRLTTAASDYATVMAANNHFSHTGPDGSTLSSRIAAAGYGSNVWAGENIAYGYRNVADVTQGWRDSPGHYANMINPRYTDVGFGQATSPSNGRIYWVRNFGAGGTC